MMVILDDYWEDVGPLGPEVKPLTEEELDELWEFLANLEDIVQPC